MSCTKSWCGQVLAAGTLGASGRSRCLAGAGPRAGLPWPTLGWLSPRLARRAGLQGGARGPRPRRARPRPRASSVSRVALSPQRLCSRLLLVTLGRAGRARRRPAWAALGSAGPWPQGAAAGAHGSIFTWGPRGRAGLAPRRSPKVAVGGGCRLSLHSPRCLSCALSSGAQAKAVLPKKEKRRLRRERWLHSESAPRPPA